MDDKSYLVEVDKFGLETPKDVQLILPYYVRILVADKIIEADKDNRDADSN